MIFPSYCAFFCGVSTMRPASILALQRVARANPQLPPQRPRKNDLAFGRHPRLHSKTILLALLSFRKRILSISPAKYFV